ncbi:thiosulfate sulfurtransferase GlpE [Kangiella sp. TOML190]|uniref:thiosulfate sulfurtransferase GlpE n=1 Tax=Kangiella sp. TOML190 TaxID=2931351 RepID=UPI00203D50EA|nr:thiosulfate sulfurtransferase GlpE [Kangiella sp. TOML190]
MNFKRISIEDTLQLVAQKPVLIFDIRDPQSFAVGRMPRAINVNNQNVADVIESSDKTQPLIVVCYHGHSSQPAAQYFAAQGFAEVYSMDGGFEVWKLSQAVES